MAQFPQKTDLTKSCGRDSLIFDFETDSLQGNNFIGLTIYRLVNYSISSLSKCRIWLLNLLVAAKLLVNVVSEVMVKTEEISDSAIKKGKPGNGVAVLSPS